MKKIRNSYVGVDQGDVALFSDFEHNGQMWTGEGPRERRKQISFGTTYRWPPAVHVSLSLLDMDSGPNLRSEVTAQEISAEGFQLVFRTWGDSRVARVRMSWMAIGELSHEDDWVIAE